MGLVTLGVGRKAWKRWLLLAVHRWPVPASQNPQCIAGQLKDDLLEARAPYTRWSQGYTGVWVHAMAVVGIEKDMGAAGAVS